MLNKQNEILQPLVMQPWRKQTFTEILAFSKKKSKSYVASTLNKLAAQQIVMRETVGRLPVYSLNLGSPKAQAFGGFVLEFVAWGKKHIPYKDLEAIIVRIPTQGFVFLITGSYAKNKQTDKSDIDIVVIIDDSMDPKRVYADLQFYCEMNIPPIHPYVFRNKEFIQMLTVREANYGKEIVKNSLVLCGGQTYLRMIWGAIQHGFRRESLS